MYVTAIIAAGGRGERFGGAVPKQLVEVLGQTILERSVNAFLTHADITDVVVALPDDLAGRPPAYLTNAKKPVTIVSGGATPPGFRLVGVPRRLDARRRHRHS